MTPEPSPDHPEYHPVHKAAGALRRTFGEPPAVAVVLGSGLGAVTDALQTPVRAPYPALHLPSSGVVGHAGEAVVGVIGKTRMIALSGRVHAYEGAAPATLARTVRALHAWGVRRLLLTNSAGSVHEHWPPGTLVRMTDHINMLGFSPLAGPAWGTRFPDPAGLYAGPLADSLDASAAELRHDLPTGVYAAMMGPAYETAAEIRMMRTVGADLVGMSTVPEALAALELGMDVAAISVVSNYATGVTDEPVDHEGVTRVAGEAAVRLAEIVIHAIGHA
jgi:purine-nucleoside phosphorylase